CTAGRRGGGGMRRTPLRRKTPLRSSSELRRETPIRRVNPRRRRKRYARDFGDYAVTVRALSCCVCDASAPSDPHHVKSRGAGGDRRDLVPLCRTHHREYHDVGRRTFEARHGVDLAAIAADLWKKYGQAAAA